MVSVKRKFFKMNTDSIKSIAKQYQSTKSCDLIRLFKPALKSTCAVAIKLFYQTCYIFGNIWYHFNCKTSEKFNAFLDPKIPKGFRVRIETFLQFHCLWHILSNSIETLQIFRLRVTTGCILPIDYYTVTMNSNFAILKTRNCFQLE